MDAAAIWKYGQNKLYRKFECPVCKTDLHHSGCCCEIRPAMIPTNQCEKGTETILVLPGTFLDDEPATDSKVDNRENRQDGMDDEYYQMDTEKAIPDNRSKRNGNQNSMGTKDDNPDNMGDKDGSSDSVSDDDDDPFGRLYDPDRYSADDYFPYDFLPSSAFNMPKPDGSERMVTNRLVVYDIGKIPQPLMLPRMRLRAQFSRLGDPRGWDCRVTGGRLDHVVDPVCGQCLYDLTRYRWLLYKYDVIEMAWIGYNCHDPFLPEDLPGGGLQQFSGLSWKLAVIAAYLCSDSNGQEKKPTWGRWPQELDYMLRERCWTKGVVFVDWRKAEKMPEAPPKPSGEASNSEDTDAEDPEALALSVDWQPSEQALANGLRIRDMDGMGGYIDWDEFLQVPGISDLGISKVPMDRWGQAFGRKVQKHEPLEYLEGHGEVILQTENFSYCMDYNTKTGTFYSKGPITTAEPSSPPFRCPVWLSRTIEFIVIHGRSAIGFGLFLALLSVFWCVRYVDVKASWNW